MYRDHPLFRLLFTHFLHCRGYSRPLAREMALSIDWQTIWAAILKFGPILLAIFLAILPLLARSPDEDEEIVLGVDGQPMHDCEFAVTFPTQLASIE